MDRTQGLGEEGELGFSVRSAPKLEALLSHGGASAGSISEEDRGVPTPFWLPLRRVVAVLSVQSVSPVRRFGETDLGLLMVDGAVVACADVREDEAPLRRSTLIVSVDGHPDPFGLVGVVVEGPTLRVGRALCLEPIVAALAQERQSDSHP